MRKHYFGTDGIRGQVGKAFITAEFMLKLGFSAGKIFAQQKSAKVVIGRDTRISGEFIQAALQAGLSSAGVDVYLLDVIPTPAVAYLTRSLRATAGIVISASHNLYYDNGVKFFDQDGMKLSDAMELSIEAEMAKPIQTASSKSLGLMNYLNDAAGRYIEFCKSTFPSRLTLKGLRIVVDCAQGAGFYVAPNIFYELGAEVIPLAAQPDGFNINKECGATALNKLKRAVTTNSADVGIALDGDGDRLMMVDHQGEVVDGDEVLGILATQTNVSGGVVGTVMSNLGLEQALQANNIEFIRANVGDRYVLEELVKRGWRLGGENSGHVVNLDVTTTGDGIITALQVLRVMQQQEKTLHELKQVMTKRPQVLINVPCNPAVELAHYPALEREIQAVSQKLADRGRVLIRPSGTQPYVRVMVEGNDQTEVQHAAEVLAASVKSALANQKSKQL